MSIVSASIVAAASAAPVTAPPVPATSPAGPTSPASPREALWSQAEQLGLLAGNGAVGGALGAQLSQPEVRRMIEGLSKQGLRFVPMGSGKSMTVEQTCDFLAKSGAKFAVGLAIRSQKFNECRPLESWSDLRTLDAFYGETPSRIMKDAALIDALKNLMAHKVEFYRSRSYGGHYSRICPATVYAELTQGFSRGPINVGRGTDGFAAHRPSDLIAMSYFEHGGSIEGLQRPDIAQAIRRDLDHGVTFHSLDKRLSPQEVYHRLADGPHKLLYFGLGGAYVEHTNSDEVLDPSKRSPRFQQMSKLYEETVLPRVQRNEFRTGETAALVRSCAELTNGLELEPQWRLLLQLREAEARDTENPMRSAVDDLLCVVNRRETGESVEASAADYMKLRAVLSRDDTWHAHAYLRDELNAEKLPVTRPVAQSRERFRDLAARFGNFFAARELLDALECPTAAAAYPDRVAFAESRLGLERQQRGEDGAADRVAALCTGLYVKRLADESDAEVIEVFDTLAAVLHEREGWTATRDAFFFLHDGLRQGQIPRKSVREATQQLLDIYALHGDLEQAKAGVQWLGPSEKPGGSVQAGDDYVVIGGVKVPRRRAG
jgi:hypothetical protein